MTVMIVDDNASIRQIIRSVLAASADTFCECTDGSDALETYKRCHPDWVLMDIRMKEMDGFEATEAILSAFPEAKIIIVTQYNDPKLHTKALRAGVLGFVLKEDLFDVGRIIQSHGN